MISGKGKETSKLEMLDDWKLTNYFCLKHLHKALGDLLPVRHSTDVIENG